MPRGIETISSPLSVLSVANNELIEVARRSDPFVLRQRDYGGLSSESWMSDILKEMESRCPMVHKILCSLLENDICPDKKKPGICLIYGIMMFLRCHELSRVQMINSILLAHSYASVDVSFASCPNFIFVFDSNILFNSALLMHKSAPPPVVYMHVFVRTTFKNAFKLLYWFICSSLVHTIHILESDESWRT